MSDPVGWPAAFMLVGCAVCAAYVIVKIMND